MLIKVKKNWKDFIEPSNHISLTRRDLLARGLATGAMGILLPDLIAGELLRSAEAAPTNCPAPVLQPGALAQIFAEGGPTMGARFISEAQAAAMNSAMATNYGISGTNLVKLGPNMVVDSTSPFGFTLLQGPPGYPGGAAAWKTNVLNKISGGGHLGPFNADDGAGINTGLLGGVSPFKISQMGKDININAKNTKASWSKGLPAAAVAGGALTTANLVKTFSLTPAAAGLTTAPAITAASNAANAITQALASVFNVSGRKNGANFLNSAGCAFYGNATIANPAFATSLFTPSAITALTSKVTVASLSAPEQAQIAAYYQSAVGVAGGVIMELNGRDYHGKSPQNVIAPADIEEARAIVMFLAACDAAQAAGAMIYLANGQAIASGVQSVPATVGGTAVTVNAPVAKGDAGGAYNAGLIIFYDPKGSPPAARFTGTLNTTNGSVKIDPNVGSTAQAVAGLYLSAMQWINKGTIPPAFLTKVRGVGVASNLANVMVI